MTFSDFAKLIHTYIGTKKDQQEFVPYLLALVMSSPSTHEDEELNDKDEYYPYSKMSEKSAAGKVYRGGNRNFPIKTAKFVNSHFTKTNLIDEIYELEDDTKNNLCNDLKKMGYII